MEQVDLYREHYPVGSMARLALEMGLNIAARRRTMRTRSAANIFAMVACRGDRPKPARPRAKR
jgi:hypothetical protein